MSEPKRPRLEGPPPDGVLKIDEPDIETGGDPDEPRDPDSMPEGVAFMPEHVELAPEHVETMRELEDVQQSLDQLNDELSERVLQLEAEYSGRREPLYSKRNALCRSLPGFWKRVFLTHPVLQAWVGDADELILDFVTDVEIADDPELGAGAYRITIRMDEDNPFFPEREIVKEFVLSPQLGCVIAESTTQLTWREGMGPGPIPLPEEALPWQGQADTAERLVLYKHRLFGVWLQDQELVRNKGLQDELAEALKEDVWPDPVSWWRESMQALEQVEPDELEQYNQEGDESEEEEGEDEDEDEDEGEGAGEYLEDDGLADLPGAAAGGSDHDDDGDGGEDDDDEYAGAAAA